MAEYNQVYQKAVYYDIAFNRDVSREVDFTVALYHRQTGADLHSTLDIACGPGYHAREFAKRGIRAVGLDLRPEMLVFAQEQAALENVTIQWIAQDMRRFELEEPVDMAISMFDGIDALLTNIDLIQHFQAVTANLTENGLFLIDVTHPRDCSFQDYGTFVYNGCRNETVVDVVWATNMPTFDLVSAVAQVNIEMRVSENGRQQVISDTAYERLLLPQELALLAERSGMFQAVGWYGDFDLNQPLDNSPASRRLIAIMQKVR